MPRPLRRFLGATIALAIATTGAIAVSGSPSAAAPSGSPTSSGHKLSVRLERLSSPALLRANGRTQAAAVSLPAAGAGSLLRRGDRLLTYVKVTDTSAATVDALRGTGATIVHVSSDYRVVTVAVTPDRLSRLARVGAVTYVTEAISPRVTPVAAAAGRPGSTGAAACRSVVSEGDGVLRAAQTRSAYKVDGRGIKVGILSDSWDVDTDDATSAAQDVASGDLPGPGNPCGQTTPVDIVHEYNVDEGGSGADEGRAMGQLVHDLAPGATLMFATAFNGEYAMADYIVELADRGATVITDDVTYYDEPFYQRGPIGNAVRAVAVRGVTVTSSAGNSNTIFTHPTAGRKDVGAYDSLKFRSAACPAGIPNGSRLRCHDFDGSSKTDATLSFTLRSGGGMLADFQNAQPLDGVKTDFDVYLLDHSTHRVLAASDVDNVAAGNTMELLSWDNDSGRSRAVDLVVARAAGSGTPALRTVFFDLSGLIGLERPVGTGGDTVGRFETFGHNADPDALTIAAADWATPTVAQPYSSRGPSRLLFNAARTDGKPATPFASPKVYAKPDLTAVDHTRTTFFYGAAPYRFSGTSAAAPHVAGVAALLRQVKLRASAYEIKQAILTTAVKLNYSANSVGVGRVDSYAAAQKLVPLPVAASGTR